ncbi:glycosyltransferase [Agromyces larvae]|uniref:Glycosyltransferase n=1 Tax=Agromyces larvae TaxID=2929802 RepID=A0ABY4C1K2_9MICO|nr:glycosyltransferase [Agromyces larvae]UOE44327.1 glycosyltransferase [Agromyces larvae]
MTRADDLVEPQAAGTGAADGSTAPLDVVFTFSYETWNDACRRGMMRPPDRLAGHLIDHPGVRRLVVANPWRWAPTAAGRRVLRLDEPFPSGRGRRLHTPLRLGRRDPEALAAVERSYRAYGRSIARAAADLDTPAVITANPLAAGFGDFSWAGRVTYYGRDDWSSSPARREYWPAYREAYRRIADTGVAVAAVSQQIIDRIAPTGPHLVVPNGVEPGEWLGPAPAAPDWFDRIPAPRAVYVGTLDSRLDVEGIESLARARPDVQLVLVGPQPDPGYLAGVGTLENVHVHAGVGRAELAATLRHAEVALLAHRVTRLTEAMSPLKVYEYLAAGAPVVSIDLPPVRGLGDRVRLVDRVADFVDVIDDALADGPAAEPERQRFITENSWESRHRAVLGLALGNPNMTG